MIEKTGLHAKTTEAKHTCLDFRKQSQKLNPHVVLLIGYCSFRELQAIRSSEIDQISLTD